VRRRTFLPVLLAVLAAGCDRALAPLVVAPGTRLVVVAPHPDDETIGSGGLLQRVVETGGTARVIVVTAGDGFREAAAAAAGNPNPTRDDYRALGRMRAAELREAVGRLGLDPDDVVELGEPDGGLDDLSTHAWSRWTPFRAPETGRGPFSGEALYARLRKALVDARPTLVVASDPDDLHPDHAAAGWLTSEIVEALEPRPRLLTYLVHDATWPPAEAPEGVQPPPPDGPFATTRWVSLELTTTELARKRLALHAHRSQWPVLGGLLARFLRRNEIFAERS
jgi:LmbE family N-acetylglucosaminyl deacetylase